MEFEQKNGIFLPLKSIVVPKGMVLLQLQNIHTGKIVQDLIPNMVVDAGKNAIAAGLLDTTKGNITYCAVGTNTVAPAAADVLLGAELARKAISVRSSSGKVATFQTFFTASEAVGTLREAGLFGDLATATANTGTLFCRLAINRVKSSNDTLTLSWAVTIG